MNKKHPKNREPNTNKYNTYPACYVTQFLSSVVARAKKARFIYFFSFFFCPLIWPKNCPKKEKKRWSNKKQKIQAKSISSECHGVRYESLPRDRTHIYRINGSCCHRYCVLYMNTIQTFLLHSSRQRCCCSNATDLSASLVDRAMAVQRLTSIILTNISKMQPQYVIFNAAAAVAADADGENDFSAIFNVLFRKFLSDLKYQF